MSLNWREIDLILSELPGLVGSRVQQVHAAGPHSLVLELYQRREVLRLLLVLAGPYTRLHRLSGRKAAEGTRRPASPPRFVAFLRAHLRGGRIVEARQVGRERIVKITVIRGDAGNGDAEGRDAAAPGTAGDGAAEDRFAVRELPGPGSFNERIEAHYAGLEAAEAGRRRRQAQLQELESRESGLLASLDGLRRRREEYARYESLRASGDLILAHLHTLRRGDRWLQAGEVTVELDPRLAPAENAQRYFQRYRKAKSGLAALDRQIALREEALARVQAERAQAERMRPEAEAAGPPAAPERPAPGAAKAPRKGAKGAKPAKEAPPGLSYESHGLRLLVGRTAAENDRLLRRFVHGNDWWFHARDYPGAYVFVRSAAGKSLPLEVMLDAGNLAVFYSKGRQSGGGDVYYTRVKYLRRVKEGRPGQVIPTQERNLSIRLDPQRLRRLTAAAENSY